MIDDICYNDIGTIPFDLLVHVERSKICSVSKYFETVAVETSRRLSSQKLLYVYPSLYCTLVELNGELKETYWKYSAPIDHSLELTEIIEEIVFSSDYHLFVRLKPAQLLFI